MQSNTIGALSGKVAVVTGASKGMGRHFVSALVAQGMKVAGVARPSADLDTLEAEFGDSVLALPCDVRDPDAVNAAIARTAERFGRIDVVINNAAIFHPFAFDEGSDELIRQHIEINLTGTAWMIRAAIPHLRETRGQIVSVTSESVRNPFPMLALYAATKAAVEVLSEGLREELRGDGVRVSVLRSGSVDGTTGNATWSPETVDAFMRKIVQTGHASMSGIPATPQSMAQALVAILSLPPDVNVFRIEVGSAREGMPGGAPADS